MNGVDKPNAASQNRRTAEGEAMKQILQSAAGVSVGLLNIASEMKLKLEEEVRWTHIGLGEHSVSH